MATKLSCHWQRTHQNQDDDRWLSAWRPLHIKIVFDSDTDIPGLDTALKYVHPNGRVIIRHYLTSENFNRGRHIADANAAIVEGKQHAAHLISKLWPIAHDRYGARANQLLWTGLNEPNVWSTEPPNLTAIYYQTFLDELHIAGLNGMVLNLGVGWPGNGGVKDAPPIWAPFSRVRDAMIAGDVLGLHEYHPVAGPHYAWKWLCGRYLQCPWDVPIVIGECGLDDAVAPGVRSAFINTGVAAADVSEEWDIEAYTNFMAERPPLFPPATREISAAAIEHFGFHGLSPNFDESCRLYMEQLAWYDNELLKDDRIQSAMMFTYDFAHPWETFDIRRQVFMEQHLLPYVARMGGTWVPGTTPAPHPEPEPIPVFTGIEVVDINNRVHDEAWLKNETGIYIDRSLRTTNGANWVITALQAAKRDNYSIVVSTGDWPRAVGRYWPNAGNHWPNVSKPPNVPAPDGAESHAEFAIAEAGGLSEVTFMAGPGDKITNKNGVNKFWMPQADTGTDVLCGMGILPGVFVYVPLFELFESGQEPEEPEEPTDLNEAIMRWEPLVKKYCGDFDYRMFLTIIALESAGNPNIINSISGATGLGQVMPKEAGAQFINRPTRQELLDPETNVEWMCAIYNGDYGRYKHGSMPLERALCSYYGGSPLGENLLADDSLVYLRTFISTWKTLFPNDVCIAKLPDASVPEYKNTMEKAVWFAEESVRQIEAAQASGDTEKLMAKARELLLVEAIPRLVKLRDLV